MSKPLNHEDAEILARGHQRRETQMLATGAIMGIIIRELQMDGLLLLEVEPVLDADGNYEPVVYVTGKVTGTRLKISVEDVTGDA